ncbi:MAG: N-6 DNA methylase [Rhodanobacteraceae bacterium]
MNPRSYQQQSRDLIDGLKAVCASNGLGNDGNEYKIIVQTFLYKLLCDKFAYEMKRVALELANAADWIAAWQAMPRGQREMLELELGGDVPRLGADQLIASIFNRQAEPGFAKLWDDTLIAIAAANHDIFAVQTDDGEKVPLFDRLSEYLTGSADRRDGFVRAPFNKLVGVSFERLFEQKYDFYAALFEYLIKDYNKDNGGKYAEYYTPHAVATIMADILVPKDQRGTVKNVTCYDPASGSGTLLMALAHAIGEDRCSIFAQDISQKSSSLLRLNLVLNKLVHSIPKHHAGQHHPAARAQGRKSAAALRLRGLQSTVQNGFFRFPRRPRQRRQRQPVLRRHANAAGGRRRAPWMARVNPALQKNGFRVLPAKSCGQPRNDDGRRWRRLDRSRGGSVCSRRLARRFAVRYRDHTITISCDTCHAHSSISKTTTSAGWTAKPVDAMYR